MGKKDNTNTATETVTAAADAVAIPVTVMPEPEGGWPADEYTGKGGRYVRDPVTGVRSVNPASDE